MSFRNFLTEAKNSHMEHAEDNVLNLGVNGARQTIEFFTSLRDMLRGNSKSRVSLSVKWDGAPSVFAGIDPTDGKFFVAKKGIFNKNPKVYKTMADIDADTSGDLNRKLKLALQYFPELGIKGILQGDFLFDQSDLKTLSFEGEDFISFHPNTLVYAVPNSSGLASQIKKAKVGVVWHTYYTGDSFESLNAEFNKDILSTLKQSTNVWATDAVYRDVSGTATLTKEETDSLNKILSQAGKLFNTIPASTLNAISQNEELLTLIKTFNNTKVRAGEEIKNTSAHVDQMIKWITNRYQADEDSKKTDKGKEAVRVKRKAVMAYFANHSKADIVKVFDLMNLLVAAKNILIKKLDTINKTRTFLSTKDGYRVTGHEGFVVADHLGNNAVKLVDRLEFSRANFSPDIIKGWQR